MLEQRVSKVKGLFALCSSECTDRPGTHKNVSGGEKRKKKIVSDFCIMQEPESLIVTKLECSLCVRAETFRLTGSQGKIVDMTGLDT